MSASPAAARLSPDTLARLGLALAAVAFAAQTAAQLIDFWGFDLRFAALNGNSTSSVFSWVSAAAILGTALAFAGIAISAPAERRFALATAALFAFLLVDNRAHIHERLAHGKLVFLPLLGAAFALLWNFSGRQSPRSRALVRGGLVLLAASLCVHLLGPTVLRWGGWHALDWQYQVKIAVKESTEKAGWILVCFGALVSLRALGAHRPSPRQQARPIASHVTARPR